MKSDLDQLMGEYKLDALVVVGDKAPNAYRDYLTRRSKAVGTVIKKRGEAPVFIVGNMEIDEAAKSGLQVYTWFDFDYAELYKQHGNNTQVVRRELFLNYFRKLNIAGRVAMYGVGDIGDALLYGMSLQDSALNVELVVGGEAAGLFNRAYATKDPHEIEALKETAARASRVVRNTWEFISGHYASGEAVGSPVIDGDGRPLTIGAVRRFIRAQEFDLGLESPHGLIFAQGRDAAIPHNHGEDNDVLQVGKSIVFDYYPRGLESGYYHDTTRTWCPGHAPDDVQALYDDVFTIFKQVKGAFRAGEETAKYQLMVLDYFEAKGHPTLRSRPGTLDGYVHGLGHGLGLNIHEEPGFAEKSTSVITPGNVYTVEPGLYYPERGMGCRVEDTVYVGPDGTIHTLTDTPYDLVLPLRQR